MGFNETMFVFKFMISHEQILQLQTGSDIHVFVAQSKLMIFVFLS